MRPHPSLAFILTCASVVGACASSGGGRVPVEVVELDAATAARALADGRLTSRALVEAYLARIAAIDQAGPSLHAVIATNLDALAEADARDAERAAGRARGPLHGLPILLKDNIDATPMATTAGSLALAGHHPRRDAFLVARLRAAGAVILGKANLSEWANFRSTRATSGWSSIGGQVRNPYVLDRNPCGSSSGSAVAVAASLALLAVGTETDGSITCPSAVNGVVGLKPTLGLVSRDGIVPIAISQDTAGPMGRTVADVAALLQVLATPDPNDAAAPRGGDVVETYYPGALTTTALAGKRVGVLRQALTGDPGTDAVFERALAAVRALGATVVDVHIDSYGKWDGPELEVLLSEFKAGLADYLRTSGAPFSSLAEIIAWNTAHAAEVMPWFGQEMFVRAEEKGPLTEPDYAAAKAEARRLAGPDGLLAALDRDHLDVVVAPTVGPSWPTDLILGDHFVGGGAGIAAVAGTPSITVPMGDVHGLPVGLAFMGRAWSEASLLGYAFAFEQATRARVPPGYLPTLPVEAPAAVTRPQ